MTRTGLGLTLVAVLSVFGAGARAGTSDPAARFREASSLTRAGDYPRALQAYRELATQGHESASLYWNWAQAAAARGAVGEALWALLRGRELEPGDRALQREIERLRENANLDAAEVQPEPLAALARLARLLHLDLLALLLFALSLLAHAWARWGSAARGVARLAWTTFGLGVLLAAAALLGSLARPTAVVAVRGATLYDAASPTAAPLGTLREAEVVPILERSRDYLRIEDGSGARGWAQISEVWPLERPGPLPAGSARDSHFQNPGGDLFERHAQGRAVAPTGALQQVQDAGPHCANFGGAVRRPAQPGPALSAVPYRLSTIY